MVQRKRCRGDSLYVLVLGVSERLIVGVGRPVSVYNRS